MLTKINTRAATTLFLVLVLPGCGGFKEGYDKSFKASYLQSYTTSCTKGAAKRGVAEASAQKLCGCMGQYLVDHRSAGELTQLSMSPNSKEMVDATKEAATSCVTGGYDDTFKTTFAKSFTKSCATGAVKQGTEAGKAQRLCECMGAYLVEHRAPGDLVKMSADPRSPELVTAVQEAANSCPASP